MNSRVLVVDDQEQIHDDVREMLLPRGATASAFGLGPQGLVALTPR